MRALVLQHVAVEGPGTLASYLARRGWTLTTVALYKGARLPEDAQEYQAVIVMGGPMGVYDEAEYPFLGSFQIPVDSFNEPLAVIGWRSTP